MRTKRTKTRRKKRAVSGVPRLVVPIALHDAFLVAAISRFAAHAVPLVVHAAALAVHTLQLAASLVQLVASLVRLVAHAASPAVAVGKQPLIDVGDQPQRL